MMELAKMATGLVAKSGVGPWLRGALLAAMAGAVWWLWVWLGVAAHFSAGPGIVGAAVVALGMVSMGAVINHLIESDVNGLGWRHSARWVPLALWAQMTSGGKDVRLWALLLWPLLVPGELAVCVFVAVAAAAVAAARVLNVRLKWRRSV